MEADTHYNETSSSQALPSMKILVAIAFILILGSLGSALFFLMRDKGKSNRTVQALALRVGLSITLFLLILLAHKLGYIQPTGIH
jgi:cytochrome bd-type quinol oxidase subunit 2